MSGDLSTELLTAGQETIMIYGIKSRKKTLFQSTA
jgi:hypothetical protein